MLLLLWALLACLLVPFCEQMNEQNGQKNGNKQRIIIVHVLYQNNTYSYRPTGVNNLTNRMCNTDSDWQRQDSAAEQWPATRTRAREDLDSVGPRRLSGMDTAAGHAVMAIYVMLREDSISPSLCCLPAQCNAA